MKKRTIQLYVKTHNVTGLKYFGMFRGKDVEKYRGSGKYWRNHLLKHGNDVSTTVVWSSDDYEATKKFAIEFSREHNIVESCEWANLKEETLDGGWDYVNDNGLNGYKVNLHLRAVAGGKAAYEKKVGIHALSAKERAELLLRDGVHIQHIEGVRNKVKETNTLRYGSECVLSSEYGKSKTRSTLQERYGVDNPMRSAEVKQHYFDSIKEKYGVDNISKSESIKKKKKEKSIKRYGVTCPLNTPELIEKKKAAMREKRNRPIVKLLEEARDQHGIKLPKNYALKKDEVLEELYASIAADRLKTIK